MWHQGKTYFLIVGLLLGPLFLHAMENAVDKKHEHLIALSAHAFDHLEKDEELSLDYEILLYTLEYKTLAHTLKTALEDARLHWDSVRTKRIVPLHQFREAFTNLSAILSKFVQTEEECGSLDRIQTFKEMVEREVFAQRFSETLTYLKGMLLEEFCSPQSHRIPGMLSPEETALIESKLAEIARLFQEAFRAPEPAEEAFPDFTFLYCLIKEVCKHSILICGSMPLEVLSSDPLYHLLPAKDEIQPSDYFQARLTRFTQLSLEIYGTLDTLRSEYKTLCTTHQKKPEECRFYSTLPIELRKNLHTTLLKSTQLFLCLVNMNNLTEYVEDRESAHDPHRAQMKTPYQLCRRGQQ